MFPITEQPAWGCSSFERRKRRVPRRVIVTERRMMRALKYYGSSLRADVYPKEE
jgi:hypothetical protein